MNAHQRGISTATAIAAEHGIPLAELRAFAAASLADAYREQGITDQDIGSSDVSITLAMLANEEPELLRVEAQRIKERNELVASIAARTGKTQEETLANLQRLLAPIDESEQP